jgi:hypothetical protein
VGQVHIWKTGVVDVTGPIQKRACYFVNGPHEQVLAGELVIDVPAGEKASVGPAPGLSPDVCYQVDVADSCSSSSIMPGLIAVEYMGPCDPPPPPPPPSCEEEWRPECGEAPCEDEPVLVGTERTLAREGVCAVVQGDWGPIGCRRTDAYLVVETWKQCDMLWTTERYERDVVPCECGPTCELPEVEVLSWSGPGDPESECAAFGDYVPSEVPDFWICKAGNDREVWLEEPTGSSCRNGKDVSHTLGCACS